MERANATRWIAGAILLGSLCSVGAIAEPAAEGERAVLRVRPDVCVTTAKRPSCDVDVTLTWRAPLAGNYCVEAAMSAANEEVACWQREREGLVVEKRALTRNFEYQLIENVPNPDDAKVLARAQVTVVAARSKDKRRNRRRRHVWSVL